MLRGLKLLFTLLPIGVAIGGVLLLVLWSRYPERFPLRVIEVREELKKVKTEELSEAIAFHAAKGFFGLDVEAVQKKLGDLSWVANVSVRRVWPDRIVISIKERTPQALWEDSGILSTEGIVFYPDQETLPSGLPRFNGPIQRVKEMQQEYFVFLERLGALGLTITELNLTPDGVWQVGLDNGIKVILGKTALDERMGRFLLVYKDLQAKRSEIVYLDLRYTNGMAIGWKKPVQ